MSLLALIIFICGIFGAAPCGNTYITGVEEESVILQLGRTEVTSATWELCTGDGKQSFIARTYPQRPVEVLNPLYNGRLFSTPDGSLVISKLTMKDQGIYNADLFVGEWTYLCDHRFNLTIIGRSQHYGNGNPTTVGEAFSEELPCPPKASSFDHDISSPTPCRNRHVTAFEGDSVTLQLGQTDIETTTWEVCIGDGRRYFIANTLRRGSLEIRDVLWYNGRLSSAQDGSLIITKLTMEDQRIYNADLFRISWQYRCDQRYNLTVIRRPPVIPNTPIKNSNVVFPCPRKSRGTNFYSESDRYTDTPQVQESTDRTLDKERLQKKYSTMTIVRLALSVCILIISLCFFIHHVKTEVLKPKKDTFYVNGGIFGAAPCQNTYITGVEEEVVILQLNQTEVTSVTWELCTGEGNRYYIAHTFPRRPIEVLNPLYNGRLFSAPDGSLVISKLTMKDQGIYNADLLVGEGTYLCDQRFKLNIIRQSRLYFPRSVGRAFSDKLPCPSKANIFNHGTNFSSESDRYTDTPQVHKSTDRTPNKERFPKKYSTITVVRLALSVCILIISLGFFIHHVKTEVLKSKRTVEEDYING
ncbi:SLAM family member 9-like [Pelobates cultripes]|uniref:SLAM family member 9-like n=1 Tax=Pelobates cultripes TaxID=61616 RepID=A0AAD1WUL4_PELCU|nr:SLAM family member 9-like [Pelobates cultripes]